VGRARPASLDTLSLIPLCFLDPYASRRFLELLAGEPNMTNSLVELQDVPVEIICLSVSPPVIRNGRVTCEGEGPCEVVLAEPEPRLEPGMRVVLDGGPDRDLRIKGLVTAIEGLRLRVETERVVPPDKRSFPRMYGGIYVRYRVLAAGEGEEDASAWVAGGDPAGEGGAWREPDPFMDFSGTGLRFEDQLHCKTEDRMLIELKLPSSEDLWRATARVVRVDPIRRDDLEGQKEDGGEVAPSHQIAVEFMELPTEATEALTAFAMRIQDALLKTEGSGD
jgi:hypothetical protein